MWLLKRVLVVSLVLNVAWVWSAKNNLGIDLPMGRRIQLVSNRPAPVEAGFVHRALDYTERVIPARYVDYARVIYVRNPQAVNLVGLGLLCLLMFKIGRIGRGKVKGVKSYKDVYDRNLEKRAKDKLKNIWFFDDSIKRSHEYFEFAKKSGLSNNRIRRDLNYAVSRKIRKNSTGDFDNLICSVDEIMKQLV